MASKSSFNATEWNLIKDAPEWVNAALAAADGKVALATKMKESKGFKKAVANYKSGSQLVQDVVADDSKPAKDIKGATVSDAIDALEKIAALLDKNVDRREADKFRDFLVEIGRSVAESAGEGMLGIGEKVSKKETSTLKKIESALKATDADKKARAAAEARAEAKAKADKAKAREEAIAAQKAKAEAKAAAEKAKAEARAKAEAEKKAKKDAIAQAQAKVAAAKAKAEAKVREAKAKAAAKAKAERDAELKAEREAKAKAKVAAAKAKAVAKAAPQYITEHTVVSGESLSLLSKKYYNSVAQDKWMLIYEANKAIIGDNPNLIRVGQVLKIPKLPS